MSAKITFPNSDKFVKQLKNDIPDAARFAAANTISRLAYAGVVKSERSIKRKMKLRNKYTVGNKPATRGIKYNRAKPRRNMSLIHAEFGAIKSRSYLADQEEGFTHKGVTPANTSRTGKKYGRRINKKNYLDNMKVRGLKSYKGKGIGKTKRMRAMFYLAHKEGYGHPGTNQFFYVKNGEYNNFKEGFFQFARKSPRKKNYSYPNLKKFFHGKNTRKKTRYGQHWMSEAIGTFSQTEVDKIFSQEAKKQLKRQNLI